MASAYKKHLTQAHIYLHVYHTYTDYRGSEKDSTGNIHAIHVQELLHSVHFPIFACENNDERKRRDLSYYYTTSQKQTNTHIYTHVRYVPNENQRALRWRVCVAVRACLPATITMLVCCEPFGYVMVFASGFRNAMQWPSNTLRGPWGGDTLFGVSCSTAHTMMKSNSYTERTQTTHNKRNHPPSLSKRKQKYNAQELPFNCL